MKFGSPRRFGKLETWKLQGELLVLNFFSMSWSSETPLFISLAFLISPGLPPFLLHKSERKRSQRATARVFHEVGWINRRDERALCLRHPLYKELKIKSHTFLLFNSQS